MPLENPFKKSNRQDNFSHRDGGKKEVIGTPLSSVTKRSWLDGTRHFTLTHMEGDKKETFSWDENANGEGSNPHYKNNRRGGKSQGWTWGGRPRKK